jgi:spore coat protein U-like protein
MRRVAHAFGALALAIAFDAAAVGCSVSAVNLVFSGYQPLRTAHNDATGAITVTCVGGRGQRVSYSISLDTGAAHSFHARRMQSPSGTTLRYNVYVTPSHSVIWGDGNGGTSVVSDAFTMPSTQSTRQYPVYGRIFARQNARVGTYTDSLVVTLSF